MISRRQQSQPLLSWQEALEQEHQTASFLRRSLRTTEEAVELMEKDLDEAHQSRQTMQRQLAELQQTLANERLVKDQLLDDIKQKDSELDKAEKLIQQIDVLRREGQMYEAANEILDREREAAVKENQMLCQEKEALAQEHEHLIGQMNEIRNQYADLVNKNDQLQSEIIALRDQAGDSSLTDDLLIQVEALRIKAENYETERDEALSETQRMRREVGELRSVIEIYLEQIKDVQSLGDDKQLVALRNELEMVRQQAHEDLEQMRRQLRDVESRSGNLNNRDVNDVATQQALRQEMISLQQALSEKDHLLRCSQNQCRGLEDAIEDRDKEVDHLKHKLEILLRKSGGLDDSSLQLGVRKVLDSSLRDNSIVQLGSDGVTIKKSIGRLFRKNSIIR